MFSNNLPSLLYSFEKDKISFLKSLPQDCFYLQVNGVTIENGVNGILKNNLTPLTVHYRVRGGKGGFQSLLKAFRIGKSSNQRDSRDLNGRRLADIEEEKRLKKWIEGQSKRELLAAKQKLDKYIKCKNSLKGVVEHKITDEQYFNVKALIEKELSSALDECELLDELAEVKSGDDHNDLCDENLHIAEHDIKEDNKEGSDDESSDEDFDFMAGPSTFGKKK
uniref:Replication stress response regulator SDE2 n=1 Tax=Rhabditophanes sp. KR3021 TaxID=114890 RepID=A0AC35UIK2_9BILA